MDGRALKVRVSLRYFGVNAFRHGSIAPSI